MCAGGVHGLMKASLALLFSLIVPCIMPFVGVQAWCG